MIKTYLTESDLDNLAQIFKDEIYSKLDLKQKLQSSIQLATVAGLVDENTLYNAFASNLDVIITGKPKELEALIDILKPLYDKALNARIVALLAPVTKKQKNSEKVILNKKIFSIFNYKKFTDFESGSWAHTHSIRMSIDVCPYCNMQYTFTYKTQEGKTRPQFDHFMCKDLYPYFAMSFYNLVPSCYVCNASFKGSKKFLPSTHIHPLVEDMSDCLVFKTNVNKVDFLMGKSGFEISMIMPPGGNSVKKIKADKNAQVFHLSGLYEFHKEYAGELVRKAFSYTDTKIDELLNSYSGGIAGAAPLFRTREQILTMLFGSHLRQDMMRKRSLGKLSYDILKDLGISL
jgi:hypothetical protein